MKNTIETVLGWILAIALIVVAWCLFPAFCAVLAVCIGIAFVGEVPKEVGRRKRNNYRNYNKN